MVKTFPYLWKGLTTLGTAAYQSLQRKTYKRYVDNSKAIMPYTGPYMRNISARVTPSSGGGVFRGRFKGKVTKKDPLNLVAKYGYAQHRESAGGVSHDHCAYIGASSYNHDEILLVLATALIRQLFSKPGPCCQDFQDVDQYIRPTVSAPNNFAIRFGFVQVSNGTYSYYYSGVTPTAPLTFWFNGTTTLRDAAIQLAGLIRGKWVTAGTGPYKLVEVAILADLAGVTPLMQQRYDVSGWKYHLYSNLSMKIQAVTPADDGAVLQATDITANPLQGRLYRFTGITPTISEYAEMGPGMSTGVDWGVYNLTEQVGTNSGLIIPLVSPDDAWKNPPPKTMFSNCKSYMDIRLQPGEIKYSTIQFKYHGTLDRLLVGMYGTTDGVAVQDRKAGMCEFGTCFLFAFEKVMRTGTAAVKLNYQFDVSSGCIAIPKKSVRINQEVSTVAATPTLPSVPS